MRSGGEKKRLQVLRSTGHTFVLGGPGAGKTTLALQKANVAASSLAPGQAVLFLSFSRAAVARLEEAATEVPGIDRGSVRIQTFHSFCWELLKSHGYLLGAPRRLTVLAPHEEAARSGGAKRSDEERWAAWHEERTALFMQEGLTAFDLFGPKAAELIDRSRRIRDLTAARYPLVVVDEAQDTNEDQWALVRVLSEKSIVVCLADPNQMIYDWMPGVGPKRMNEIRAHLSPMEVDLGTENHRSQGTEIVQFGDDVLVGKPRSGPYEGVGQLKFGPKATQRDKGIRSGLGMLRSQIAATTGSPPATIAMLARTARGVRVLSNALSATDKPIAHRTLDDETSALLGARLLAFVLEPKLQDARGESVSIALELLAAVQSAAGTAGGQKKAETWQGWTTRVRGGDTRPSRAAVFMETVSLVEWAEREVFTGDPRVDWSTVRTWLRNSSAKELREIDAGLDNLLRFKRGKLIASGLASQWQETGSYSNARLLLDAALAQDQMMFGPDEAIRVQVMTMHKAKGKQFDGVLIFRDEYVSPLVTQHDKAPYEGARRLVRVSITRARQGVLVLAQANAPCPILGGFNL